MTQVEDSIFQLLDLNQEKVLQIEKFVNLMIDLKIIEPPEHFSEVLTIEVNSEEDIYQDAKFKHESIQSISDIVLDIYQPQLPSSSGVEESESVVNASQVTEDKNLLQSNLSNYDDNIDVFPGVEEQLEKAVYASTSTDEKKLDKSNLENSDDAIDAFKKLQYILVGNELNDLHHIADVIQQHLTNVEHQVYDPEAVIKRLIPLIGEILKQKIADSQEEIVQAIAPIIDQTIQKRIEQNKASMSVALAPAIPQAISRQISIDPEEFSRAIAPTLGRAIKKQIEIESDIVVDALYPIIGSTISKYMAETIRAINQQVEETFSIEGIKRKINAKLQGVSEAELILKEAIPFTIQAIFLIHKTSGLVIADIQPSDVERLESDMIAGMLTAIRSFANDCITRSGSVSELDAIDYGTSKIILEVAGYCYLAIVIQGKPPKDFLDKMRQILKIILKDYGDAIEKFDGDSETIPNQLHPLLSTLRNDYSKAKNNQAKSSPLLIISLTLLSIIVVPLGIWQYRNGVISTIENQTSLALASTPELAVYRLTVEENQGKLKLKGKVPNQFLREKAGQITGITAKNWLIDNQILAVEVPADPILAAAEVKRVTAVLNQIDGIAISTQYIDNKVFVEGRVSRYGDAIKATKAFEQIPGVKSISNAVELKSLQIDLRFYFAEDSANLIPADLNSKVKQVKLLLNQQPSKYLKIIGYSYSQNENYTGNLAIQRAKAVKQALINQGVNPSRLQVLGRNGFPPGIDSNQPTWLKRCVVLEPIDKQL